MKPTVGRIVHYFEHQDALPEAAIVTATGGPPDAPVVSLTVFHTHRLPTVERAVPFAETVTPRPGSVLADRAWWPPREEA